jgi:hypothetical protein
MAKHVDVVCDSVTKTRTCLEPSFWDEVAPYYMPCYVFFVSHIVYQTTGNMLVTIWLAYILNMPNCV